MTLGSSVFGFEFDGKNYRVISKSDLLDIRNMALKQKDAKTAAAFLVSAIKEYTKNNALNLYFPLPYRFLNYTIEEINTPEIEQEVKDKIEQEVKEYRKGCNQQKLKPRKQKKYRKKSKKSKIK
jgi:hypothetical protein